MIKVSYQAHVELRETLEDMVEFWINEQRKEGELISGETAWKMISCLAAAKEAEFGGMFD